MEKENRTPRQWLLDYSNYASPECFKTVSDLLDAMDANGIQYTPCYHVHTEDLPDKIYFMGNLRFDLAITCADASRVLIKLDMPDETLGQMEEIPGCGFIPSKAYEWLLKEYLPEFDSEEADTLYLLSQMPEHLRNMNFKKRMKLVDDNTTFSPEDRITMYRLIEDQMEFFILPEEERQNYFDNHRNKLDFNSMSKEERYDYLKAVDTILRPIIGNNGFPNWRVES